MGAGCRPISAGTRVKGVARIGVLRANSLGDYIMALPALYALKAAYPGAELTLIGAAWHVTELSGRPGPVDEYLELPPVPEMAGAFTGRPDPARLARFVDSVRDRRFDLAVQLHGGGAQSNPLVTSFGARVTVGSRASDAAPLDRWVAYDYYQPEVFRYLEVVGLVGAEPVMVQPVFERCAADDAEAARVIGNERPAVALHPGASDPRRRWPADRFVAVGRELADTGVTVLVTGGEGERELVDEVAAGVPGARGLAGAVSLGGLAGLLARCAVVVGNDTGPIHLARAVDAGTVGIYWCGNLVTASPVTRARHRPIVSWTIRCPECGVDCVSPLYPDRTGTGCEHRPSFVTDVPASEVSRAALDLLADAA